MLRIPSLEKLLTIDRCLRVAPRHLMPKAQVILRLVRDPGTKLELKLRDLALCKRAILSEELVE